MWQPGRQEILAFFGVSEPERRRGTGTHIPAKFTPPEERLRGLPNLAPGVVFCMAPNALLGLKTRYERFIGYSDRRAVVMFTDGVCMNSGQPDARAGWGFFFGPEPELRTSSGRLEQEGPFGDVSEQTSNRAELRAATAGLRGLQWNEGGYNRVVIASNSEYLVEGATTWVKKWVKNGWKTNSRKDVKNKDLWELLLGDVERYHEAGVKIEFWRIPREFNEAAYRAAREGAEKADRQEFFDIVLPRI